MEGGCEAKSNRSGNAAIFNYHPPSEVSYEVDRIRASFVYLFSSGTNRCFGVIRVCVTELVTKCQLSHENSDHMP